MKKFNASSDRKFSNTPFKQYVNEHNNSRRRVEYGQKSRPDNTPKSPYEASVALLATMHAPMVKLGDGESADQLIRRFKKAVEYSGIMHELKKREYYQSDTQKRKEKRRRAIKKLKKRMRKFQQNDDDRK